MFLLYHHPFSPTSDSVLHNPHLGLSETLHKLYALAKSFADVVVPQVCCVKLRKRKPVYGTPYSHGISGIRNDDRRETERRNQDLPRPTRQDQV